jgi:heat shock protein HslJ
LLVTFILLLVPVVVKLPAATLNLEDTSWVLVSWGEPTVLNTPLSNTRITAKFKGNIVSGNASCNQYMASYQTNGSHLTINHVGVSRKLCAEEIMRQEGQYLTALQNTQHYYINNQGQLQISYTIDQVFGLITFNPN